jgi:hypothetical protein
MCTPVEYTFPLSFLFSINTAPVYYSRSKLFKHRHVSRVFYFNALRNRTPHFSYFKSLAHVGVRNVNLEMKKSLGASALILYSNEYLQNTKLLSQY